MSAIQRELDETGYSRFPVVDQSDRYIGYVHIKDVLPLVHEADAVVDLAMVRPLPGCRRRCRCPTRSPGCDATTPPGLGHRPDGSVSAMVTLEDLVEDLVGTVRDGTHRG